MFFAVWSGVIFVSSKSRCYNVCFVSYVPLKILTSALNFHRDLIRSFAYIFHDRFLDSEIDPDNLSEKDSKVPHFHCIIRFYKQISISTVQRWFWFIDDSGKFVNTFAQKCSDVGAYFDYMWHNPLKYSDKFPYSQSDIVCSNIADFKVDDLVLDDSLTSACRDLLLNTPTYTLLCRYGRDFIIHRQACNEIVNQIRAEMPYFDYTEVLNV